MTTSYSNQEQEQSLKQEVITKKTHYHDKQSVGYIIRSGLAGGIAGSVAKTVIAPLDRVKILFQASNPHFQKYAGVFQATKKIYNEGGPKGLLQGHSATILRIFPYAAIKFVAYEQFRHILMPTRELETSTKHLLAGSLAGVTSVLFTYPLELLRVRLAFEVKKDKSFGMMSICKQIWNEGAASSRLQFFHFPIINFYRGIIPTIMGIIPYAGVSFWTHYELTEFCISKFGKLTTEPSLVIGKLDSRGQKRRVPLKTWAELTVGGLAGAISQTAGYPLEVIRRRMQVYGAIDSTRFVGLLYTAKTIWKTNGFRGFFVGLSIGYLKC
ncbi:1713_t:CDS:2 [Entrophospora sp. SA101]|nr:1713_t:CDS:2 [Entrophospora sp. SA101]